MLGSCSFATDKFSSDACQSMDSAISGLRKDKFTVIVEGNIGCGKTTFLRHFEQSPHVEIVPEPVAMWTNVQGKYNTLDMMYKDAKRWGLAFQSYVQLTLMQLHQKKCEKPVKLMERSIYSARACFCENLHESGVLPDVEYEVLNEWFVWMMKKRETRVDLIVYLRADPETCIGRIKKRSRSEEAGIPLDYLEALHELHENWLMNNNPPRGMPIPAPVLVLDANKDISQLVTEEFEQHRSEILCGFA